MKKTLIVLGSAFLVLIVLALGVFAAAYWVAIRADAAGKAYVDGVTPPIISAWSAEALVAEASPELLTAAPRARIDALMDTFSKRLGALQRYGGATRQHYVVNFTLQGPVVTMTYSADAAFEKGPATLRLRAVRRAGQWKLQELYVQSDALLR